MTSQPCGSSRPSKGVGGALSYHTSSYWNARFATDPREAAGFEWLSSSSSLLSSIPPSVLASSSPKILHIGVGTSSLSLDLARYYHAQDGHCSRAAGVMNVDFAPRSIEFQRTAERHWLESIDHADQVMQYKVLDLLDWSQVCKMQGGFDVVLDKSTADSISTGQDLHLDSLDLNVHPAIRKLAQHEKAIPTIQILGIHLAALVSKGGVWLCHSYSSDRWADLVIPPHEAHEAWPWKLTETTAIPVVSSTPNAPQIHHHIYTLHRI